MNRYKVSIALDGKDNASSAFERVNQSLGDMRGQTLGVLDNFGSFGTVLGVAAGAFAAMQIGQKVLELRELGAEVRASENTFRALADETGGYNATLDNLRTSTRGVVDDMTLMQGASQMLRTGVAGNAEELSRFTEMAIALKQPTDSAADALNNFTLMMSNESIARLDSYGISAEAVRSRITELTDAGIAADRSEAFRMAVLEEGASAMDRLGDSIEQNVSQVSLLETRFANFTQGIASGINDLAEGLVGIFNGVLDSMDETNERAQGMIEEWRVGTDDIAGVGALTDEQRVEAERRIRAGGQYFTLDEAEANRRIVQDVLGEVYDSSNLVHQALVQIMVDYHAMVRGTADVAVGAASDLTHAASAAWEARSAPGYGVDQPIGLSEFTSQTARYESIVAQQQRDQAAQQRRNRSGAAGWETQRQSYQAYGAIRSNRQDAFGVLSERVRGFVGDLSDAGTAIIEGFEEVGTAAITAASSLAEITGEPRAGGAGSEGIQEIAGLIEDPEQRAAFLRRTGETTWGEDTLGGVFENIAGLPEGQRSAAASQLAEMLNTPGFDMYGMSEADIMQELGFMQGGTTGAGTFATVTPYGGGGGVGGTTSIFAQQATAFVEGSAQNFVDGINDAYGVALDPAQFESLFASGVDDAYTRDAIAQAIAPQIAASMGLDFADLGPGNSIWENPAFMTALDTTLDSIMAAGNAPVTMGGSTATVGSGSTLSHIAAANDMTVEELIALNPGIDPYGLQVGQQVRTSGPSWQRVVGGAGPEEQGDAGWGGGDETTSVLNEFADLEDQIDNTSDSVVDLQSTVAELDGMRAAIMLTMETVADGIPLWLRMAIESAVEVRMGGGDNRTRNRNTVSSQTGGGTAPGVA